MKTTNKFSALSLALIFCTVTFATSAAFSKKAGNSFANPVITHQVTVNITIDKKLCNVYLVRIVDGNGNPVAPAKIFKPGVTKYAFFERGPATGVRVAMLVQAPSHSQYICENELFTSPATLYGPFKPGEIYTYNLFPKMESAVKE